MPRPDHPEPAAPGAAGTQPGAAGTQPEAADAPSASPARSGGRPRSRPKAVTPPSTSWPRPAKLAFIGSHGIRKTSAVLAFAATAQRAGCSVDLGREVVRDNPLGINESATGEAQLWVLVSQIRQELELARKANILVTDRGVMDNYAYYLRACHGEDHYAVEPLVRRWSATYDLVVRLLPDIELAADGVRSTNDAFRDEVEAILDRVLPDLVPAERLVIVPASSVTSRFDWQGMLERLAGLVGAMVRQPTIWT
jgi:nicotinamide riboside kinase